MIQEFFQKIEPKVKELLVTQLEAENPEVENLQLVFETSEKGKAVFEFMDKTHEVTFEITSNENENEVNLSDEINTLEATSVEESDKTDENRSNQEDKMQKLQQELEEVKSSFSELSKKLEEKTYQMQNNKEEKTIPNNNKSINNSVQIDGVKYTQEEAKKYFPSLIN